MISAIIRHATDESYETVAFDEEQYCITEQIMVSSHCVFFTRRNKKTRQKLVDIPGGTDLSPPGLKKVQDFGQNSIKPPLAFPSFLCSDRHAVLYSCFWCQIMSIGAEKLEETLLSSQTMFCFHESKTFCFH